MYECTVFGDYGGITVWMGDFFHCSNGKQEIALVHSQFTLGPEGEASNSRTCNSGDARHMIVGKIVRVENGSFTSQLNVTLPPDSNIIAGKSIECAYDNGTSVYPIGTATLNFTAGYVVNVILDFL
jgi:molybdopterin-binding protein